MNQVKVKKWLERQLWGERDEGPVVRVVAKHISSEGKSGKTEIWSCKIPHGENSVSLPEEEIPDLLRELHEACFDDAEGMANGLQRYQVLVYVKHKPHAHSRFTFSVAGASEDIDDTGVSEPNNQKGLLAQLMRHNEALMRTTVMTTNQNVAMLQRTISSQNHHIEKLLEDRRENSEMVEDLKSQKHERELATQQFVNKEERYKEMFDKASLLLPAVVNRISGKKLLPEKVSPMQDMLKNFAESLSPEQLNQIIPTLKPEQQIALVEFMDASQENRKQLAEKAT